MSVDAVAMLAGVPDALRPLLPEVWAALREQMEAAGEALGRGDAPGVLLAAHALKGASMRFGLEALAREAAVAEEGAVAPDLEAARVALERFAALLATLEAAA